MQAAIVSARSFVPLNWVVTDRSSLEPFYQQLRDEELASVSALENWMLKVNELDAILQEDVARRYIRMTCNTADPELARSYTYFMEEIAPFLSEMHHALNLKYWECPFRSELTDPAMRIFNAIVENETRLFRPENIPLQSEISVKSQEYAGILGAMTVQTDGQTLTLQQASARLQSTDRNLRERIWKQIAERRAKDKATLDNLFDELTRLRNLTAKNAGYTSYTDFRFQELNRFDYTRTETRAFRKAVETAITPLCSKINEKRKQKLQLDTLRPWDTKVDIAGGEPLRPFSDGTELLEKTIQLFDRLKPELAEMIREMSRMGHFDLNSRVGKAPGGYNYPLYETGVPFIFMNAVGTQSDVKTMVHECGHAFHSFLSRHLKLNAHKDVPSEIAELASMSMELMTMNYWDVFYQNPDDLRRAKFNQLTGTITILPWIAAVDEFQESFYDTAPADRDRLWEQVYDKYHSSDLDWSGHEHVKRNLWHSQLHIFEVPFYYIEYGIAQLGALQVWMNYSENPDKGLEDYLNALSKGYTRPVPELYRTAGVDFDFSESMVKKLADRVEAEIDRLI